MNEWLRFIYSDRIVSFRLLKMYGQVSRVTDTYQPLFDREVFPKSSTEPGNLNPSRERSFGSLMFYLHALYSYFCDVNLNFNKH